MSRKKSERAAEASRRNGARSQGPRSAEGKATSAGNARTHGLFAPILHEDRDASTWRERIAGILQARGDTSGAWLGGDIATEAAVRLEHATRLVQGLGQKVEAALEKEHPDPSEMTALLVQLARMRVYQRRFRGRRDRALRTMMRNLSGS